MAVFLACGGTGEPGGADGGAGGDDGKGDDGDDTADDASVGCVPVASEPVVIAAAGDADEYALLLPAAGGSATSWDEDGNEGLILDVSTAERGVVGQIVLHHGDVPFEYGMALGALAAGEEIAV